MLQHPLLEYLSGHSLFSTLEKQEIESLAEYISEETIPASSYVFLEEEKACHFYILREGELRAFIGGKMLANIKPGRIFGEIAMLNGNIRAGSVYASTESKVVKINGREILNGHSVPVSVSFRILKELIKPLTSLQYTNDFYRKTKDLVANGEGDRIEFKSSLRYNYHTQKYGREIEHASMKTIAAFLNSWGGILLIGVDDRQNILGTENDRFENDDRAMLHLTNLVKERLGSNFLQFITISMEMMDDKKVMRIDVNPANVPAFLSDQQDEHFYVRTGPSTTVMKPSQLYDYIHDRFYRPKA